MGIKNDNILIYNVPDSVDSEAQHHCAGCSLKATSNRCVFSLLLKVACDGLDRTSLWFHTFFLSHSFHFPCFHTLPPIFNPSAVTVPQTQSPMTLYLHNDNYIVKIKHFTVCKVISKTRAGALKQAQHTDSV